VVITGTTNFNGIVATGCGAITLRDFNIVGASTAAAPAISSLADSSGIATLVTASSLGVQVANQWVVITGTTNFNGTFQLLSFNNSTRTYTFSHGAAATETRGTASLISPPNSLNRGIVISSTRSKTDNVSVRSFEGDGLTIDGSGNNANLYEIDHVHSAWNGGSGFVSLDCNGQVGTFLDDDAQLNRGDGFQIGNGGNTFISTNTNSNASVNASNTSVSGIGYHFTTGTCNGGSGVPNNNTGSVFSDAPNSPESIGMQFESGANANSFFIIGSNAPINFEAGANSNTMTSSLPNVTLDAGSGNRYQSTSSQLWNAFNVKVLQIGASPGTGGGIVRLFNSTSGTTTVSAPTGVTLNPVTLFTPNPNVDSTLLASAGSAITPLSTAALGSAGCEATITISTPGATSSSKVNWTFATDPSAVAGYGAAPVGAIQVYAWPTAGAVHLKQCSAVAVTPGAISVSWEVH
jgi:hypothetical protein